MRTAFVICMHLAVSTIQYFDSVKEQVCLVMLVCLVSCCFNSYSVIDGNLNNMYVLAWGTERYMYFNQVE